MTIEEFTDWAAQVAGVTDATIDREKLSYLALGLTGEAGEVAEMFKKLIRDGKLDRTHLAEELGDLIYYWACLCRVAGASPRDLMEASRAKIDGKIAEAKRA